MLLNLTLYSKETLAPDPVPQQIDSISNMHVSPHYIFHSQTNAASSTGYLLIITSLTIVGLSLPCVGHEHLSQIRTLQFDSCTVYDFFFKEMFVFGSS